MKQTNQDIAIITGGGSGIGAALALALAERELSVLVIGRREQPLTEVCSQAPQHIHALALDVSLPEAGAHVRDWLQAQGFSARILVHNAAILEPVAALAEIDNTALQKHMAINFQAPLLLAQALLDQLGQGGRQLFISSGAAYSPIPGWGAYCCSKAALHMLMQQFAIEFEHHRLASASLRPGVVDTPMQAQIRQFDAKQFPEVERFRQMHRNSELISPRRVAEFARSLLLDTPSETFHNQAWDIRDSHHVS